ncbi:hypothetical protein COV82_05480 [Candidatus Peregrinibacteria bacterium CG11_big_fil_rev_8_21_14_0_20_46_8]|nr:MAG: hypothetical protein COV82_05480 [Candidatus Peregrinibacteria bacterium CG11_big_fil_rev_8_21_14_0_20_46_8]
MVFVLEVVAPPPPVECTQLTLTPTLIPTGTTSQQFTVSVDPPDYSGDINWIHTRNGLTWSRATVPGRSGTFTVNELNQTSAVDVIATLGNAPACRARAIVQPPRFDACRSLTITPNTLGPGVTQQEFEIAIDPMSFAGSITAQHIKNGTVVDSTTVQNYKLLFRVTGIDATSVIRATATPDEPTGVCVGEVRPTDEPPPPPPIACTSLTASPTLIERGQSTQTFQASITPASGFTPTITWVHSRPGEPDEVVTAASATFTTLNDSSTIRVSATPVAPGATCAATIPVRPGGGGAPDCQALSVSPNQILRDNPRQSFSANVFPNNFPGTVTWTHVRPGLPPETQTGRSVTFTTLTNDSRINVQGAPVASGASCQADLSVAPPGGGGGGGPKLKCEDLTVEPDVIPRSVTAQANNELTFSALAEPLNFFGGFTWVRKEGDRILETITHQPGSRRSTVKFEDLTPRTVIEVEVDPRRVADGRVCKAIIKPQGITRPPDGELVKRAFEVRSRGNVIAPNETAEFQVTFTPLQNVSELTLLDRNMRNGILNGSEGSRIELVKAAFSGRDFKLEVEVGSGNQRADIPRCSELPINANSICYTGSPFTGQSGLRVENMTTTGDIILTYRGKLVNSVITKAYCRTLERSFCGEKFVNEVFDNFDNRANATLFTPCPFLLTQGIGDVILERDLSIGSDISSCGDIPNIEGPIITPKPPPPAKLPGTGPGQIETLRLPRHTICQQSNTNSTSLPEAYRNPIESLSSAICEITSSLANDLERPNVRADITENITRITRFNENLGTAARTITNLNTPGTVGFNTSPNPNFEIYKIKDADLTINTNLPITGGAKTYVIENGDLIINSNIKYDTTPFNLTNIKSIPSIAFIVINGNIKVAPHVTELNGIFVALDTVQTGVTKRDATAKAGQAGKIIGTGESNQQLYIEGLIYGDIEPIFDTRSFIGNARRGTGTIVINYDGRLFYNPPPGIEQVLDLQQEQVAR